MNERIKLIAFLLVAMGAPQVHAQSEYYRVHPLTGTPAIGRLGEMTKDKVRLDLSSGSKEIAVNEIKYVQLPSEPRELMEARNFVLDGKFEQGLTALDKIPPPLLANEVIRQDADYYRTLAGARLAINHQGDAKAAGTVLVAFINANKNSYHFYEANETAGELLLSIGRNEQAVPYFQELARRLGPTTKFALRFRSAARSSCNVNFPKPSANSMPPWPSKAKAKRSKYSNWLRRSAKEDV